MKKLFLIIMMFLLPYQYAWAMVANYDTHQVKGTQSHFGHHEHQADAVKSHISDVDSASKTDGDTQTSKNHVHYGFCHMPCGELLNQTLPAFEPIGSHFSSRYLFNYHSPPASALERPNWIAPV
ncbi:MAG: hypothetical protein Q8M52_09850 [Methylotenera sp.]|nr:hypothetical protein [Methylotenera sp.]